jgi:hypothetical protein
MRLDEALRQLAEFDSRKAQVVGSGCGLHKLSVAPVGRLISSIVRNHDAIWSDAHVRVEAKPVLATGVGRRVEAIAINETGIVNVRAAVEQQMPRSFVRLEIDGKIGVKF